MKKIIFSLGLILSLSVLPAQAADNEAAESAENITPEVTIHMGYEKFGEIKKMTMEAQEDDLYADTNVEPLNKEMSEMERNAENLEIFDNSDSKQASEILACDNPALKQQIINFIYQKINKNETRSVIEKRVRALLVKNMQDFKEITNDKIVGKNAFNTRAAMMELRVNKHFPAQKVCASKGNKFDDYESIYAVIYEDEGYYKVIVTNFMTSPNKTDDATFIFNWQ